MNEDEKSGAFVRWQETSMNQFSYVNYLILTLSLAILSFAVSLMFEDKFDKVVSYICLYNFSLKLLLISIIVGIICAFIRLEDFRKTARIARRKQKGAGYNDLKELRACAKCLGKWSRCTLWIQSGLFGIGFTLLMLAMGLSWRL